MKREICLKKKGQVKNFTLIISIVIMSLFFIPVQAKTKKISFPAKKTITAGESVTLKLKNNTSKVKWFVSNQKVVKITKKNNHEIKIKAIKSGHSVITAKIGKKKYNCKVTIKAKVTFPSEKTIVNGAVITLKLKNNTSDVKWSTSNKKVIKIVKKSKTYIKIKAIKVGKATITAKIGKKKYKCKVKVEKGISFVKSIDVIAGQNKVLKIYNTGKKKVAWSTSNKNIVRIIERNMRGVEIQALKKGSAKITAKVEGKKYVCKVNVAANATSYSYAIFPIMPPFNDYFYVKTDNPDPSSICFVDNESKYYEADEEEDEKSYLFPVSTRYLDVKYENSAIGRVNGGYIFSADDCFDGGTLTMQMKKIGENGYSNGYEYVDTLVKVECAPVINAAQYMVDTYTDNSMSFFEKLDNVQRELYQISQYPWSVCDAEKRNKFCPYPNLAVSPYHEMDLNVHLDIYEDSEFPLLLTRAYPYILHSLDYPAMIADVALYLDPTCQIMGSGIHSQIEITKDGVTKEYGGAGPGNDYPLLSNRVKKIFLFNGASEDYALKTDINKYHDLLEQYSDCKWDDMKQYVDQVKGDTYRKTIGSGSWIRVGHEGEAYTVKELAYVTPGYEVDEENAEIISVEDAWVDGRYININNYYEKGATFEQHPTADIWIRNMNYTDHRGRKCCSDVCFKYNENRDLWISRDYYHGEYGGDDDPTEEFILTKDEVEKLNVDQNTNIPVSSGLIYDGSAEPGTPFG